jgi:hypothetical protein
MSRKRGKLHQSEEKFIKENLFDMSIEDIANALNRTTAPVKRYIRDNNLQHSEVVTDDEFQRKAMLNRLYKRNYYGELKNMLTASELGRFEEDWIEVILQFRDDIVYTEEVQLKQWILLQILADRSMKARKNAMEEEGRLNKLIDEQEALPEDTRDNILLNSLHQQVGFTRDGMIAFTREHSQILDKIKDIEKSLKATRDARVKRIEDSKTTWLGYLRMMEDVQNRKDGGDDAEIKRIAKEKEKERLSQWHKYEDGVVDQPFLTPETVKNEREIEQENEN